MSVKQPAKQPTLQESMDKLAKGFQAVAEDQEKKTKALLEKVGAASGGKDQETKSKELIEKIAASGSVNTTGSFSPAKTISQPILAALGMLGGAAGSSLMGGASLAGQSGFGLASNAASNAMSPTSSGLRGVRQGVGMLSQGVGALSPATAAFSELASAARPFVEALNPSSMLALNQASRDLQATIGVGLQPVITAMTLATRQFADMLLPISQKLQPVMAKLTDAVGGTIKVLIDSFGETLTAMLPGLKVMADMIIAVQPLYQAGAALTAALVRAMSSLATNLAGGEKNIQSAMERLRGAFEGMATFLITSAAKYMKYIGKTEGLDFIDTLIKSLSGGSPGSSTGLAAATSPTIGQLPSYNSAVMQSALIATSAGDKTPKTSEDWLKLVVEELKSIRGKELTDFRKDVDTWIALAVEKIIAAIGRYLGNAVWGEEGSALRKYGPGAGISAEDLGKLLGFGS